MQSELVSIVLPIYNVEKYLNRCIESIINQTYKNLEIILVDDGSPDNCPLICDEWVTKDERIRVIHKQNSGLGMARNTGIEYATGQYICFFDSDDYVEENTIEKCLEVASKYKADVVCFGYSDISADGHLVKRYIPHSLKEYYSKEEVEKSFLPELLMRKSTNLNMAAWAAMYSMETVRKIKWSFVSEREIVSEDVYSLLYLYKHVNCVAVIEGALYNYCDNGSSLTRIYKDDRYSKIRSFYINCLELSDALNYDIGIRKALVYPYLANTIAALKQIVLLEDSMSKKLNMLKSIIMDDVLQRVLQKLDYKMETKFRRCLFYAMKNKAIILCYIFLRVRSYRK